MIYTKTHKILLIMKANKKNMWLVFLVAAAMINLAAGCEEWFIIDDDNGDDNGALTVQDASGNTYTAKNFGGKIWMTQNLKHLPEVHVITVQDSHHEPRYFVYGYNGSDVAAAKGTANYSTYGVLYNWHAAMISCPAGWRLPSDEDWKHLDRHLGMNQDQLDSWDTYRGTNEGAKLAGNEDLWQAGHLKRDEMFGTSGFNALPAGQAAPGIYGRQQYLGLSTAFWSSTEGQASNAVTRLVDYGRPHLRRHAPEKFYGYSVRCVKN